MADLVDIVLRDAAEKDSQYKTIEVNKDIDLEIDLGNLLTSDTNPILSKDLQADRETFLKDLARDNTQLLINKIWQQPTSRVDDIIVAELPAPTTPIPREKPVPKPKPLTKWERYAQLKGIQKKKRGRMVYDEESQSYKPRWGYKSKDNTKDWLIEVPGNADPNEDQFAKRKSDKRERIAKNELQRLRNIARSQKGKVPGVGLTPTDAPSKEHLVPGVGLTPTDAPSKEHLGKALALAKRSTASIGKFTESLPKEKPPKNMGQKRKFEPNTGNMKAEHSRQLKILEEISQQPIVNATKAANMHINEMDADRAKRRKEDPDFNKKKLKGKRSKHGGLNKTFKQYQKGGNNKRGFKGGKGWKGGPRKGRK